MCEMADIYQLVEGQDGIRRIRDDGFESFIPNSDTNRDWIIYQEWLAADNKPEPIPGPLRHGPQPLSPVRVADPQNEADAVNLRTLNERLAALESEITRRMR